MEGMAYLRMIAKNYYIRNGSFKHFNKVEKKNYLRLAQYKRRLQAGEIEMEKGDPNIDPEAPGGMQTILYETLGFPTTKIEGVRIEAYAYFLATLEKNGLEMDTYQSRHLEEFKEFYKDLGVYVDLCGVPQFPVYSKYDCIVTTGVYTVLEGEKQEEFNKWVEKELKAKSVHSLIKEHYEKCVEKLKELLPEIKREEGKSRALITENAIFIPEIRQILWKDIIVMLTMGLKYKGLYRPQLQLGAYLTNKVVGNLADLNSNIIFSDDIYRRRFKMDSIVEFWGLETEFPIISKEKGFAVFPFYDKGNYTGEKDRVNKLFLIRTEEYGMVTDEAILEYIYPQLKNLVFSKDYKSQFYKPGFMIPCIPHQEMLMPITEALFGVIPRNGGFTNLTRQNLGI